MFSVLWYCNVLYIFWIFAVAVLSFFRSQIPIGFSFEKHDAHICCFEKRKRHPTRTASAGADTHVIILCLLAGLAIPVTGSL